MQYIYLIHAWPLHSDSAHIIDFDDSGGETHPSSTSYDRLATDGVVGVPFVALRCGLTYASLSLGVFPATYTQGSPSAAKTSCLARGVLALALAYKTLGRGLRLGVHVCLQQQWQMVAATVMACASRGNYMRGRKGERCWAGLVLRPKGLHVPLARPNGRREGKALRGGRGSGLSFFGPEIIPSSYTACRWYFGLAWFPDDPDLGLVMHVFGPTSFQSAYSPASGLESLDSFSWMTKFT